MAAGQVDFKDFKIQGTNPQYQVQTRVEFKLTDYLQNALKNGVPLNARVQFRLGQHRSWWFNKDKPLVTVQYQLKYHALSRRYLLTRKDTNEHWNFTTLTAMLRKLSELRKYSLPKVGVKKGEGYYILAIADLIPETLSVKVVRRLRAREAGSRFTLRLMYAFSLLTIMPVLVVSYFSMNFIGDRIDNWFNVKIEGALDDSLELARSSLDVRVRQHLFNLERVAKALAVTDELDYSAFLERQMNAMGAYELVLLGSNKRVIVYSGYDTGTLIPHFPADSIFRKLSSRGHMYQLEPVGNDGLFSRVAVTLKSGVGREDLILTALFPFSDKEQILAENVQNTYDQYQEINYQRSLIKQGFRLTLLLIMLLSILFSVWAAFLYSQRLTEPVRTLLEGTLAVASGNLQKKLPVAEKDDFSLLARSFNTMTTRLLTARRESEESQQKMTRQHDYLSVVLDNLTSGVISFGDDLVIRRINSSAAQVLRTPILRFKGKTLNEMCDEYPELIPFSDMVIDHLDTNDSEKKSKDRKDSKKAKGKSDQNPSREWQTEISLVLDGTRRTLMCRSAELPALLDGSQGHVLVFDDISEMIQAEHDAAWSEVARRLAHEIKNPLTPIQLSAERLVNRLHPVLDDDSSDLLKRMTNTIVNQVDTMKKMVNAFSEYARAPALNLKDVDISSLVSEVVELYRINQYNANINLELDELPLLHVDSDRMRQLLVNLIKNALEATEDNLENERGAASITISTKLEANENILNDQQRCIISVGDNGPGVEDELLPTIFEPYTSSKSKGSGLGLAIVKKIVEEHAGLVFAKNNEEGGTTISIHLPVDSSS
ncbi:Nitrogen regulation protein NtrY [Nymphon striatum]|nr:Nitrogen regulation protein NtrY [Nymphon striatum]